MGICKYCNRDAGFIRSQHPECRHRHDQALDTISRIIVMAVTTQRDISRLSQEIDNVAKLNYVSSLEAKEVIIKGWHGAIDSIVQDTVLSEIEEQRLNAITTMFKLDMSVLLTESKKTTLLMARAMRDFMNGKIPQCPFLATDSISFNYQKSELPVWLFRNVRYIEEKILRQYVSGSQSVNFRIARGVYYRVGGARGYSQEVRALEIEDTGVMVATIKHIYFGGSKKSFRIPYAKIVSYRPYADGIGVMKDVANPKQQVFVTDNGWFTYNLVMHLSRWAA